VALTAEMAAIVAAPASIGARAEALLESLRRLLAFDAGFISLLDPEHRQERPLARHGYPDRVHAHLDSAAFVEELELLGVHRDPTPMRVMDSPIPRAEMPHWAEHLQPAGFGEGIGVPLHTSDGRFLGMLGLATVTPTPPSDATRYLLGRLAPLIVYGVDPMRAMATLASLVTDAVAAVLLTRSGATAALPGLPDHPLLAPDSPVLAEASVRHAAGDQRVTFLVPYGAPGEPTGYRKVTMLACPEQPPGYLRALVLLAPPGDLHALTRGELSTLGMLIAGWHHRRISARLRRQAHALVTIVDDIRTKLGAPTRDAAIIRAADCGLYLPPSLMAPTEKNAGR
jgi:hypothetical protein